jgi:hypothetical protein
MQFEDVRRAVGFLRKEEYLAAMQHTTIDLEKTFHCAASKV